MHRRFDPGGIGDLVAVISSAFDRSMRSRIQAFPTKAIARHAHPPAGDPLSRQRAQVTHQIARLEDEERLVARSRRNSTPKED